MKNVLTSLPKSALVPLGLRATALAIQNKFFESGKTELLMSNEEMEDIMKIVKSLEKSGLLMKIFSKKIKIEVKEQKDRFLPILLNTLAASILRNKLRNK